MTNKYLEKIAALSGLSASHLARRSEQLSNAITSHLKPGVASSGSIGKVQKVVRAEGRNARVGEELSNRAMSAFNQTWA